MGNKCKVQEMGREQVETLLFGVVKRGLVRVVG